MTERMPPSACKIKVLDVINTGLAARELLLHRVAAVNRQPGFENWIVCGSEGSVEPLHEAGIPVHIIDSPRGLSLRHVSPWLTLLALIRLTCFIRRHRFAIVHTHSPVPGVIGRLAAWIARVPVVIYTQHGAIYHENQGPLARKFYMWVERFMACFTDHLFFLSRYDQEYAVERRLTGNAQVHFVGNGINLAHFVRTNTPARGTAASVTANAASSVRDRRSSNSNGQLVIVAVARLDPVKNLPMLLHAVDVLRRTHPSFELWILGEGICRPELEEFVADHGLRSYVRFLGYRDDVPSVLTQADIGVLTSIKEGIPRGLVEPMAMGLPVVATDVKGNREVVVDGECGFLVPLHDHVALAQKLALLMDHEELRLQMGKNGCRRARQCFDERDVIENILRIYRDLSPLLTAERETPAGALPAIAKKTPEVVIAASASGQSRTAKASVRR